MKNLTIRFPEYLKKDVIKRSKIEKKSCAEIIRKAVEEYLISHKKPL